MPIIPAFILRRLYVSGSLNNSESGWQFTLKNSLGSGYAKKMLALELDGEKIPMDASTFFQNGEDITFQQVDQSNTFGLQMNRSIVIKVSGGKLSPGPHKIWMGFEVPGFGNIGFDFTDEICNG